MDNFIQSLKKKLSVDNLVDMMKEADVIDDSSIKEEQIRKTLGKIDPDNLLDVDEMAKHVLGSSSKKPDTSKTKAVMDAAKSSISVLQKFTTNNAEDKNETEPDKPKSVTKQESHPFLRDDNLFRLYDDFR